MQSQKWHTYHKNKKTTPVVELFWIDVQQVGVSSYDYSRVFFTSQNKIVESYGDEW